MVRRPAVPGATGGGGLYGGWPFRSAPAADARALYGARRRALAAALGSVFGDRIVLELEHDPGQGLLVSFTNVPEEAAEMLARRLAGVIEHPVV
jgi:hypothetical protein